MGKVEIGIYFCVTADILTKVLQKCSWSSHLLTIWILSKSLILIGGHGTRNAKFSREVRGSRPTAAVLCPWARHFTPRKYWLITQEAMAPSRYDWKIVDWDVKPQHNQPKLNFRNKYSKIFFSEAIRGMKLKLYTNVYDISLYINYVFLLLLLMCFRCYDNLKFP